MPDCSRLASSIASEVTAVSVRMSDAGTVSILGKGPRERVKFTLPHNIKNAFSPWLDLRSAENPAAPLFVSLTSNMDEARLSGAGVYLLVRDQIGKRCGVTARPHGLRPTAITAALDAFNGGSGISVRSITFDRPRSDSVHASSASAIWHSL